MDYIALNWRHQDNSNGNNNNGNGKTWAYEAVKLTRSLKSIIFQK